MNETGLMFKAPLVCAILDGSKTQTRRIAKLPHMNPLGEWEAATVGGPDGGRTRDGNTVPLQTAIAHTRTGEVICAPFQPGDRIYVRETWMDLNGTGVEHRPNPEGPLQRYAYGADCPGGSHSDSVRKDYGLKWRPSIHMPKSAARIWLEITNVRAERLQSITRTDIKAEGVEITEPRAFSLYGLNTEQRENMRRTIAAYQFQELWDSTTGRLKLPENKNSKRYARVKHWLDTHPDTTGWDANPWVWVYDFKRIERKPSNQPR